MTRRDKPAPPVTGGGLKAIHYVLSCAKQVGARNLAAAVKSNNACKACAFGTGGQRGGLHNEYSDRIEICNKNIQAQLSDIRAPIPPEIFRDNTLAELSRLSGWQLEQLGRIGQPLLKHADSDNYVPISYETACELVADRMQGCRPERSFFYASGRSSNEAAFLLQLLARVYGSNHVNNCSYYCHQASGVGLAATIGTGTATIRYGDLYLADLIVVLGANPASNHPRFVKTLIECRQRGGRVIVVNPVREAGLVRFASPSNFRSMISGGTEVASQYVQPSVGGDLALLYGIAKAVCESGAEDRRFIADHVSGYDAFKALLGSLDWPSLEAASGVERATMESVAQAYGEARATVFAWGMGLTHHRHGTETVEAVSNLALLRGMVGGPGRGLLPLRGHSNVQGVGSMGFTPALKDSVFEAIESRLGIRLPAHRGMDTLACLQAADRGEVDVAFLLGGNLLAATPDSTFAERAMSAIPFKVMLSTTLNQTHVRGVAGENLILPVRARDEETQPTTQESMFNFVRLSDGGFDRIEALRSEVDIIVAIAERVVARETFDFGRFRSHRDLRRSIAELIPGFEKMATIDDSREEFHIAGRHLAQASFPTPDGRARLLCHATELVTRATAPSPARHDSFVLTSVRSEGQFNTIIFNEKDVYRRHEGRDVLFMHPDDMAALELEAGVRVDAWNRTGRLEDLQLVPFDIHRGNVMTYFPEANILVPQGIDPRSRTPSFKSVQVTVERSASADVPS